VQRGKVITVSALEEEIGNAYDAVIDDKWASVSKRKHQNVQPS
jgi:hypothetical protein